MSLPGPWLPLLDQITVCGQAQSNLSRQTVDSHHNLGGTTGCRCFPEYLTMGFPDWVLLDVTLLNALLVQVFDELLSFHPVDQWTDVSAVAKERSARQVERSACGRDGTHC